MNFTGVKEILAQWQEGKETIETHFENRDTKKVVEPMKFYTEKFIESLRLLNGVESGGVEELEKKPLNTDDRISFIQSSPGLYPSYIQLDQLFIELGKLTVRLEIMSKRK